MAISGMLYPDMVAQFAGILGSIETHLDSQTQNIRIGGVREIDLSGIDPSTNVSEATARVLDLFSLTNDTVVKGYFWCESTTEGSNTYNIIRVSTKLYKRSTGQSKPTNGSYPSGSGEVGACDQVFSGWYGRDFFYVAQSLKDTYKARMILVTEYIDNIISPNGYGIVMFLPSLNTVFPATVQSWANIQRGFFGDSLNKLHWDPVPAGSMYYPWAGSGHCVLWISDEAYFQNWVKDYDPTFKITDIRDIGEVGDPIQDLDPSEPGGGEGDWDESSDPIDFPTLPTDGALSCGACKAYKMTTAELKDLFHTLWDINVFDIATFQKLLDNPLDAIITLNVLPLSLSGYTVSVWLGNFNTNVNGERITSQYVTVDCGSLTLKEFWGSALDYAPYTKVSIFLPFIGIRDLNVDDCMNAVIQVKYNIDILTGDCVAGIKCGNGVIYKFTGNVKQTVPVSGRQSDMQMNMLKSVLSGASGLAAGAAIGGAAGLVAAGASAASTVASSKFVTQRSGTLDGSAGQLDDFVPYLIVHRPIQSLAKNYAKNKGYTSNIGATLSSLTGYTEVEYIHLEGISGATDAELQEIEDLLKKGVII